MNQQHPQQQPGWGQPQQHPQQPSYPQQPGWGAPPPQPPKKTPVGMIVGFSCLGIVVLFILLGVIGTVVGGDSSSSKDTSTSVDSRSDKGAGAEKDDAPAAEAEDEPEEEAAAESPIKVTAKKTTFSATVLADGSNYTSVKVTVKNNSDDTISVNPLYFAITDTNGTKHASELAADNNQIDTVDLAPGENVSGVVTGKGKFTPEYVTYTDGLIGDAIRTKVS